MKKNFLLKTMMLALVCLFGVGQVQADEITANLVHTASTWNNSSIIVTVDAEKEAHNNESTGIWGGFAFAEFSFTLPAGHSIASATLTWTGYGDSSKSRTSDVYVLNNGLTIDYEEILATPVMLPFSGAKTSVVTGCSLPAYGDATFNTDVTAQVRTAVESQNYIIFQWTKNAQGGQLYGKGSTKAPVLTITTSSIAPVDYTINYQLSGTTVKTIVGSELPGTEIVAENAVDGEGEFAGNHYLITAATVPTMSLVTDPTSNVMNVPVRLPYTATLKLTKNYGANVVTSDITLTEADDKTTNYSYAYSKYENYGGEYYLASVETFGESGSFTDGETIEKSVAYTIDKSVVYFAEAESASGTNFVYSNGATGFVAAQNKRDRGLFVNLAPGEYEFIANIIANPGRNLVVRDVNNIDNPVVVLEKSGVVSGSFTVTTAGGFYINGKNSGEVKTNQSADFDYCLIKKVADVVTINDYAWSSYAPSMNVTVPADAEVYYVSAKSESVATLTQVEAGKTVAANTGLLVKGTADATVTFTASTETPEEITGNLLNGTQETIATPTEGTVYVLGNGNHGVGLYKYAGETLAAGKAYMLVEVGASAPKCFVFDNETTGIEEVAVEKNAAVIYNLAGQKVAANYKGVVIVNGKKVVNK